MPVEPSREGRGKPTSWLGVAGFVLAILCLLICRVPLLNLLVVPDVSVGGLLALAGLLVALANRRSGVDRPVAALLLNGVAVAGMLLANSALVDSIRRGAAERTRAREVAEARAKAVPAVLPAAGLVGPPGE